LANNPRPTIKAILPKRATPTTKFKIDYAWWDNSDLDIKTYLLVRLKLGEALDVNTEIEEVDLVDPHTAEVYRVDGFQYLVQTYFNQLPDDFMAHTSLVDAAFCVLLANANRPMSGLEIAERIRRDPETVVKTLGGSKIYQGIRPIFDED
jgi:hypothetical protein